MNNVNKKNIIFFIIYIVVLVVLSIFSGQIPQFAIESVIAFVLVAACLSSSLNFAFLLCALSPVITMLFSNSIDRWLLVPGIIIGNIVFVCIINVIKNMLKRHINVILSCVIGVIAASLIRYFITSYINIDVMAHFFEIEKADYTYLSTSFGLIYLYTSLTGGIIGALISQPLKKFIRR